MELGRYTEESKLVNGWFNYLFIIPLIMIIIFFYINPELVLSHNTIPLYFLLIVFIIMPAMLGKMTTTILHDNLIIYFGSLGLINKKIPLMNIKYSEIINYSPIKDFGGWGIKIGKYRDKKTMSLSVSGNKGVFIILNEPIKCYGQTIEQLIIGSNQPEMLYEAIKPY